MFNRLFLSFFLVVCTLGYFIPLRANDTDSLQALLQNAELADTVRLEVLNQLSKALRFEQPDDAIAYSERALALAQKSKFSKYEGIAYSDLGIIYGWIKSDYARSLSYLDSALQVRKRLVSKTDKRFLVSVAATLNNMATVEKFRGDYRRALQLYLEAIPIYTELENQKGLASCFNNTGELYKKQRRLDKALSYYEQARDLYIELDNEVYQAIVLSNMATVFRLQGKYEEARAAYQKTLDIFWKNQVKKYIPNILQSMGILHEEMGREKEALTNYREALRLLRQNGITEGQTNALNSIAELLLKQGKAKEALSYAEESQRLSETSGSYLQLRDAARILSLIHAENQFYEAAYRFMNDFKTYDDSLSNAEKSREIGRLEATFEFRQRELEREKEALRQKEEISRQKLIRNVVLVGALVLSLFLGLAYRAFRIKQRDNKEIEAKNKLLASQNSVITSGMAYAQRIQEATYPLPEEMQRAFPAHFILMRPRDLVSGDFYWVYQTDEVSILAVVDCTGHGVPGGFMSMMGNDLLNEIVTRRGIIRPDLILNELDLGVRRALRQPATRIEDGMDVSLLAYYPAENKLQFAGARHPLVYFEERPDEPSRGILKGDRMSVGGSHINEPEAFRLKEIPLRYPTTLYLYSDGYLDQFGGPENKKVKRKLFLKLLWELQDKPNMNAQKDRLEEFIEDWMQGVYHQVDDILVVGVRIEPNRKA